MLHTVYKTVNLLNGRFYIGYHKTENPNDDYLGSGRVIKNAIRKYGRAKFKKFVLFAFEDAEQAFEKEKELVATAMQNPLCYNIREGGDGGFEYINQTLWKTQAGREKMSRIQKTRPRSYSTAGRAALAAKIAKANGKRDAVRWIYKDGVEQKVLASKVSGFVKRGWSLGRPSVKGIVFQRAYFNGPVTQRTRVLVS